MSTMSIWPWLIILALIAINLGVLVLATKKTQPRSTPLPGKSMTRLSYWLWGIGSFVIIVTALAALAALGANHVDQALMAVVNVMVNGRAYTIACDDGEEEHLRDLAGHVDARVRELLSAM